MKAESRQKILALVRLHGLNVVADAVEIIDLAMAGTEPPILAVTRMLQEEEFDVMQLTRRAALTLALEVLLSFEPETRERLAEGMNG